MGCETATPVDGPSGIDTDAGKSSVTARAWGRMKDAARTTMAAREE
jgi:hypothetical protein